MSASSLGQSIVDQVSHHFHRFPDTRYYLSVVNVRADQQYNYFFYIKRRGVSTRSLPIGHEPAKLDNLVQTLTTFRQTYQLPITLTNFSREERKQLRQFTR